jgi:GTP-binding protein
MLADRAKICVRGGRGGNGCMSFRREKFVPKGGPNGGDGGRGADVVLIATRQARDLNRFRRQIHFRAPNGGHGQGSDRRGSDGDQLIIEVPVGTEVRDASGELLADLVAEGQIAVVARGGEGGRGNTCFVTATRQAPRFAERGLEGDELWLNLSLKLLADVGLVGLPNAGKSSLLAALTRARPKIAAYPFTTLEPNLGTILVDERIVVLADIPGLVEGASAGVGLGDRFLAHIERTTLLVFVADATAGPEGVALALDTVSEELRAFKDGLADRPCYVVINKIDLIDEADIGELLAVAAACRPQAVAPPVAVSALSGAGLDEVRTALEAALLAASALPVMSPPSPRVVLRPAEDRVSHFNVSREGDSYRVVGAALELIVAKADLENEEAVRYLQEVMERAGVSDALRRAGAKPGDDVAIGEAEFEFA